jgi:hypothetical protein
MNYHQSLDVQASSLLRPLDTRTMSAYDRMWLGIQPYCAIVNGGSYPTKDGWRSWEVEYVPLHALEQNSKYVSPTCAWNYLAFHDDADIAS